MVKDVDSECCMIWVVPLGSYGRFLRYQILFANETRVSYISKRENFVIDTIFLLIV